LPKEHKADQSPGLGGGKGNYLILILPSGKEKRRRRGKGGGYGIGHHSRGRRSSKFPLKRNKKRKREGKKGGKTKLLSSQEGGVPGPTAIPSRWRAKKKKKGCEYI